VGYVRRLIPVLVLALACVQPVFAQASYELEHREWEATPFLGGSFAGKFQFPTPVSGSDQESSRTVGMHYASGYQIGVRITQNLGDFWAANLEYNFANQPLRFTNLSPSIQSLSLGHLVHHFSYNGVYLPFRPQQRFRPYATAGAGVALFYLPARSKNDALALGLSLRDSWEFAGNWGGGLKYLVHDQVTLSFDVKDQISSVPSYGLPRSARVTNGQFQPGIARSGLLNNWQLNFGIGVQWDEF
jgi:opacity protein-like surface antigen